MSTTTERASPAPSVHNARGVHLSPSHPVDLEHDPGSARGAGLSDDQLAERVAAAEASGLVRILPHQLKRYTARGRCFVELLDTERAGGSIASAPWAPGWWVELLRYIDDGSQLLFGEPRWFDGFFACAVTCEELRAAALSMSRMLHARKAAHADEVFERGVAHMKALSELYIAHTRRAAHRRGCKGARDDH